MFTRLKELIHPRSPQASQDDHAPHNMPPTTQQPTPQKSVTVKEQGDALLRQGDLEGARTCYQQAIDLDPGYAKAHSNLGFVLLEQRDLGGAERNLLAALSIDPAIADAQYMLGTVYQHSGKTDEAIQRFRKALELDSNLEFAYRDLCFVLFQQGDLEQARAVIDLGLARFPNNPSLQYFMGNLLANAREFDEAIAAYKKALAIQPNHIEVLFNLGIAFQERGDSSEAVACFQKVITLNPDFIDAHFRLGVIHSRDPQHLSEAEACFRRVLKIDPGHANAYYNLGVVLNDLGKFEDALASFRRALELNPDDANAHFALGSTLKVQGKFAEADKCYQRALEIDPGNAIFRVAQLFKLPNAPQTVAASLAVPSDFEKSLDELSGLMISSPENREQLSEALALQPAFYLAYRDGNHISLLSRYGDLLTSRQPQMQLTPSPHHEKVRLLVISSHFRRHSVWDVILRGILVNLDRTRFEVVLYSLEHTENEEAKLARSLSDVWRDSRTVTSLKGWLDAVAMDKPDVIFYPEIGMTHMTLCLATRRLAALQVASWGHPITTGLPTIDMYFSGELLEAPDADTHYREQLVRLPGTGCCTTPIKFAPVELPQLVGDLAARPGPRFVVAQRAFKFDPAYDALFADIASTTGECTFILISDNEFPWAMEQLIARLNREFIARGLNPEHHLLVLPWMSQDKFNALLDLCDIYLECPSFSGYTTAWQAVHHGLPVVTLEGKFMRQRLGAGLLRKIGMPDTIASSIEDYVKIAVALATECRNPALRDSRHRAIKAAATLADNDISVVRAFEHQIFEAFAERGMTSSSNVSPRPSITSDKA